MFAYLLIFDQMRSGKLKLLVIISISDGAVIQVMWWQSPHLQVPKLIKNNIVDQFTALQARETEKNSHSTYT